jgi:hypothetical protein
MNTLQRMLQTVIPLAAEHSMDAYIVGTHHFGEEDGRLLKVSPVGIRSYTLLELESTWPAVRLYRHRNDELTSQYRGRVVNLEWLKEFIIQNHQLAVRLAREWQSQVHEQPVSQFRQPLRRSTGTPKKDEVDPQTRKKTRLVISCSCHGEVEGCSKCYGSGTYTVDGYGNAV